METHIDEDDGLARARTPGQPAATIRKRCNPPFEFHDPPDLIPPESGEPAALADVARELGLPASRLFRWIDRGTLHAFRVDDPPRIAVRPAEVAALIADGSA